MGCSIGPVFELWGNQKLHFSGIYQSLRVPVDWESMVLCLLIARISSVRMPLLPKVNYRFIAMSILIPMAFIAVLVQLIKKLIWNHRRPQIAKETLRKNKVGGLMLPDFKQYYKATIIKILWYWHQHRCVNQWTRMESPETWLVWSVNLRQRIYTGVKTVSSVSVVGETWMDTCKKGEIGPFSYTTYQNKLQMD